MSNIPGRNTLKDLHPFRFWCQKVLPLTYDDSLSYYELLCKVVDHLNNATEDILMLDEDVEKLYTFVDNYFDSLDVQTEINNKLDKMAEDGSLASAVQPVISAEVASWLTEHVTPTQPVVDSTLTISGAAADASVVGTKFRQALANIRETVTDSNYTTVLPDANNIFTNSAYRMYFSPGENIPANLPMTTWIEYDTGLLITMNTDYGTNAGAQQIFINDYGVYKRHYSNAWSTWLQLSGQNARYVESIRESVTSNNYATVLPDVNAILTNSIYRMYFSVGSTSIPAHLPFAKWISAPPVMLMTVNTDYGSNAGAQQFLVSDSFIFVRSYSNQWSKWESLKLSLNVGTAYGVNSPFSTLTEAVEFINNFHNAHLTVQGGTYDLINEFKTVHGSNFFDNYNANSIKGLYITNGNTIEFAPNAIVVCEYDGDNTDVMSYFSPFNFLSNCVEGGKLIGAKIRCKNIRYCVHDDPGDASREYHNEYINCDMYIDNRNNTAWANRICLGIGFGRAGSIRIIGCRFKSETRTGLGNGIVTARPDAQSNTGCGFLELSGCYFELGTFAGRYAGTSTTKTTMLVSNNSLAYNVIKEAQSASHTVDNVDLLAWNNVVRS